MTPIGDSRLWRHWGAVVAWGACAVTVLVYLGLKQFSYRYVPGDENIYYYMAKVMAEGKAWPYRDFFFAHPPVQLFVAGSVFKLCGASYVVARSLPVSVGSMCRIEPGVNLGLALLLWGIYALLLRRDLLGGVLLGLSAQTVVYALPGVMMILLWRFLEEPRRALRAAGAAVGLYLLISLGCLLLAGGDYTEAVFKYHLMKKPKEQDKAGIFSRVFLLHNFYLAWAPVVAAGALVWWRRESPKATPPQRRGGAGGPGEPPAGKRAKADRKQRKKAAELEAGDGDRPCGRISVLLASRQGLAVGLILYVAGYAVFLLQLREWFDFYFLIMFPALALLVGYAMGEIAVGVTGLFRKASWALALRSLLLCVLVGVGYGTVKRSQRQQYPEAKDRSYAWFDAPSLGSGNSWVRGAFWCETRHIDRDYLGPTYYLWHEMRHLDEVQGAVDFIREHSKPGDRLFGESGLAPLVAFLADRDLAGFAADTNTKRFSSGQWTIRGLLATIDLPELRYVIASKKGGRFLYVNAYLADWLEAEFREVYRFGARMRPGITWLVLERDRRTGGGGAGPVSPEATVRPPGRPFGGGNPVAGPGASGPAGWGVPPGREGV